MLHILYLVQDITTIIVVPVAVTSSSDDLTRKCKWNLKNSIINKFTVCDINDESNFDGRQRIGEKHRFFHIQDQSLLYRNIVTRVSSVSLSVDSSAERAY